MNYSILLGTTASTTSSSGSSWLLLVGQIAVLGLLLYFMLIRPQRRQQKKHQSLLSTIAAGDSVLTSSGMYGVVIDVMDDIVIVEFGNNKNCRIPMKKSAITELEKASVEKTEK